MSKKASDYYNHKGQTDRKYSPPSGLLSSALTWSSRGMKNNARDNSSYNSGWRNASKQKGK